MRACADQLVEVLDESSCDFWGPCPQGVPKSCHKTPQIMSQLCKGYPKLYHNPPLTPDLEPASPKLCYRGLKFGRIRYHGTCNGSYTVGSYPSTVATVAVSV